MLSDGGGLGLGDLLDVIDFIPMAPLPLKRPPALRIEGPIDSFLRLILRGCSGLKLALVGLPIYYEIGF
jgi:hypothetical protein